MQTYIRVSLVIFCILQSALINADVVSVDLDQATKKISEQFKGKVLGAKTEDIEGKSVHVIKILTGDGRVQHLKVAAENGVIIK